MDTEFDVVEDLMKKTEMNLEEDSNNYDDMTDPTGVSDNEELMLAAENEFLKNRLKVVETRVAIMYKDFSRGSDRTIVNTGYVNNKAPSDEWINADIEEESTVN